MDLRERGVATVDRGGHPGPDPRVHRGLLEQELTAALGRARHERAAGEAKGYRNGRRERQFFDSFGPGEVDVPRARMAADGGGTREWRSSALPRYARMPRQVEALIADGCLAGTNTHRVERALGVLFRGAVGQDVVGRWYWLPAPPSPPAPPMKRWHLGVTIRPECPRRTLEVSRFWSGAWGRWGLGLAAGGHRCRWLAPGRGSADGWAHRCRKQRGGGSDGRGRARDHSFGFGRLRQVVQQRTRPSPRYARLGRRVPKEARVLN
jgi:hypothetical protein